MTKSERSKKVYKERKKQGICTKCGKKKAREGKSTCEECAKKQHEKYIKNRDFYKSLGLCPKCGKNKLFGDEKNCPECNANNWRYLKKDYGKLYYRRKKEKLEKENLCAGCYKKKRSDGHIYCEECLEKHRVSSKTRRRKSPKTGISRSERPSYGMCYFCGNEVVDGLRVCEKCRQRLTGLSNSENAVKAREKMKDEKKGLFQPIIFSKSAVN